MVEEIKEKLPLDFYTLNCLKYYPVFKESRLYKLLHHFMPYGACLHVHISCVVTNPFFHKKLE